MIEYRMPAFITVTETYDYGNSLRKLLIPVDMIKYIQDCVPAEGKNTYLALKDTNENGKVKYFWLVESLDDIIKQLSPPQMVIPKDFEIVK